MQLATRRDERYRHKGWIVISAATFVACYLLLIDSYCPVAMTHCLSLDTLLAARRLHGMLSLQVRCYFKADGGDYSEYGCDAY
jgi:hypothetical protein